MIRAVKRKLGEEEEEEEVDRLSHLPDEILHQILSFLDTKFAVQTSLLSARFRSLWKHAPCLNFDRHSSRSDGDFRSFLSQVLDAFRDDSRIVKISYKESVFGLREESVEDLDRVLRYAESHRTPLIRIESGFGTLSFPEWLGSSPDCALELARACLYVGVDWTRFSRVASLNLEESLLYCDGGLEFDFFAKFPCLKNLVLSDCDFIGSVKGFRITGPQLVHLEIHGVEDLGGATVEIVAPKLESFRFVFSLHVPKLCRSSVPLLDHADLMLKSTRDFVEDVEENKGIVTAKFVSLFQALVNLASLRFNHHIIEAMSKICDELEQQPCPFTRLNCLKVPRSRDPEAIPDQLITYFLKGSSSTNPGFLQLV